LLISELLLLESRPNKTIMTTNCRTYVKYPSYKSKDDCRLEQRQVKRLKDKSQNLRCFFDSHGFLGCRAGRSQLIIEGSQWRSDNSGRKFPRNLKEPDQIEKWLVKDVARSAAYKQQQIEKGMLAHRCAIELLDTKTAIMIMMFEAAHKCPSSAALNVQVGLITTRMRRARAILGTGKAIGSRIVPTCCCQVRQ
jgi:hypothetical protein